MQQGLALTTAASEIAFLAVDLDLANMATDRFPALDLAQVFVAAPATHKVPAVPLKPAARIVGIPFLPYRQRLAGVEPKEIERAIIGGALRALARGHTAFARILAEAGPDALIKALAAGEDPARPIEGLHLFTFGGVRRTAEWITGYLSSQTSSMRQPL